MLNFELPDFITVHEHQTREDWLKDRESGLGGSDVTAVIGVSQYKTRFEIWEAKVKGEKGVQTDSMKAGHYLEPAIANWFADDNPGLTIVDPGDFTIFRSNKYKNLFATVDRLVSDVSGQRGVIEIKNRRVKTDEPLDYWIGQANFYTGILELDYFIIVWLEFGDTLNYQVYDFDKELFDMQVELANEFWNDHILTGTPPEPVTGKEAAQRFKTHISGLMTPATGEILAKCEKIKQLKERERRLNLEIDALKDEIQLFIGEYEGIINDDTEETLITWKRQDREYFDKKAFKEHDPTLYKSFTEQRSSRVFRIKGI